MPNTLFDSAGLAIVAYAEVMADGTTIVSTAAGSAANSGVTTTRFGAGQYGLILPEGLTQSQTRDMVFVTPNGVVDSTPYSAKAETDIPPVTPDGAQTIKVGIYGGSPIATFADSGFAILVLRTIIPQ